MLSQPQGKAKKGNLRQVSPDGRTLILSMQGVRILARLYQAGTSNVSCLLPILLDQRGLARRASVLRRGTQRIGWWYNRGCYFWVYLDVMMFWCPCMRRPMSSKALNKTHYRVYYSKDRAPWGEPENVDARPQTPGPVLRPPRGLAPILNQGPMMALACDLYEEPDYRSTQHHGGIVNYPATSAPVGY